MKKLLFALFATFISTNATAEWTLTGGDHENSYDVYVDVNTLRKTGSKAKIWSLQNYKTSQGSKNMKYLSKKLYWEFDCQEENLRLLAFSAFIKKMGSGGVVASENTPYEPWQPVAPESMGAALMGIACDEATGKNKWTEIGTNKFKKIGLTASTYVDYGTVVRKDGFTTLWELSDFRSDDPTTQSKNFSVKALREYDCSVARTRVIASMVFTGNMGIGNHVLRENISEWSPTVPGSFQESFSSVFCDEEVKS